ncbi:unnamed protein product, partial [Nesidiocoris tenuis]
MPSPRPHPSQRANRHSSEGDGPASQLQQQPDEPNVVPDLGSQPDFIVEPSDPFSIPMSTPQDLGATSPYR